MASRRSQHRRRPARHLCKRLTRFRDFERTVIAIVAAARALFAGAREILKELVFTLVSAFGLWKLLEWVFSRA